ncbi:MAG: nucleotidyltransferase family protein [Betaproteobacteria bacterium]
MPATSEQRLIEIVQRSAWLMPALRAVRALALDSWCIGAGALRDTVWDALYGCADARLPRDVDVAYFDPSDTSRARDHALQQQLHAYMPQLPWEVVNQAGVHLWFEGVFGHPAAPLASLEEAVASWPETATAVGITLDTADRLRVIAPLGLADLFDGIVRRNSMRVSVATYRQRCATKQYTARWPQVRVLPA